MELTVLGHGAEPRLRPLQREDEEEEDKTNREKITRPLRKSSALTSQDSIAANRRSEISRIVEKLRSQSKLSTRPAKHGVNSD